ncbi:MAG: helix-turn-helix domain-containing protein [Gammaproteobacteria bacterium]|nr:helix-turn-helix domain-containing protein [Gammaproteobacteria bacterium]
MKHVTILAIEEGLASSITIPLEMIHAADVIKRIRNKRAKRSHFVVASHDGEALTMTGGIGIQPAVSISEIAQTDLIFVPALWGNPNAIVQKHPQITAWLATQYLAGATICSVGTGSYFLAEASLLDGRTATTHWYYFDDFAKRYPAINLQRKRFITHADRLYCTGSVNAVRDVMLHFVEQLFTPEIADEVSHHFTHELKRSYESMLLASEERDTHHDEQIIKIQEWLQQNYQSDIHLQTLAQQFDISVRSFNRRFRSAAGQTPLQYLQEVRLEQAKALLKQSNLSIAEIAFAVGYQDTGYFSSLFKRANTITPNEYRHLVRNKLFNVETV